MPLCRPRRSRVHFEHVLTKEFGHKRTQKGLDSTVVSADDTAYRSNDGCEENPFLDTFHANAMTDTGQHKRTHPHGTWRRQKL